MRLFIEDVDEGGADPLALHLGVGDARQPLEEQLLGIHVHQRNVVVLAEQRHHLVGLTVAHHAGIDEDAGQLVANRLVDQDRRNG